MTEPASSGFMGLAALMRRGFEGQSLQPIAEELIRRAQADAHDAAPMLDLSIALELNFQPALARAAQAEALKMQALYRLPAARGPGLRLLALMAPGDLSTNAPLDLLLEDSDVALDLLYVGPGVAPAEELPEHDVMFVAVGESEATHALLEQLEPVVAAWPRPVIHRRGGSCAPRAMQPAPACRACTGCACRRRGVASARRWSGGRAAGRRRWPRRRFPSSCGRWIRMPATIWTG